MSLAPSKNDIEQVFDKAIVTYTGALSKVVLKRDTHEMYDISSSDNSSDYKKSIIYTMGTFSSSITCKVHKELYNYIIGMMSGNMSQDPDEQLGILYFNEYFNIICGQAVSRINDGYGQESRISVPYSNGFDKVMLDTHKDTENELKLVYYSEYGRLLLHIKYVFNQKTI